MLLLLVGAVLAVAARPPIAVVIAAAALIVVILAVGQVYRSRGSRRAREEATAGYSTLIDAAGFDFRDSRTGALIRSRDTAPLGSPNSRVYDQFTARRD